MRVHGSITKRMSQVFWRTFFLDILQWHYAIATLEDKLLFLQVAFRLWTVPECSIAEAIEYHKAFQSKFAWSLPDIHTAPGNISSFLFQLLSTINTANFRLASGTFNYEPNRFGPTGLA